MYHLFSKEQRAHFDYWFAHWCAFNMVAVSTGRWKIKYLFHDMLKPFHMLLCHDYKKVQKWHRTHARHHLEYAEKHGVDKLDMEAMCIDWECSRLTKSNCPRTCLEEINKLSENMPDYITWQLISDMVVCAHKLGFEK